MWTRFVAVAVLSASGRPCADRANYIVSRGDAGVLNTVPQATWHASGAADVMVHVVRDASGKDNLRLGGLFPRDEFPNEATVTGIGIAEALTAATLIPRPQRAAAISTGRFK